MTPATWLLAATLALVLLPSNTVATALPLLRAEWGATATEMGWVFASYQVGYVGGVLLVLPLTDRLPVGRVIVVCTLGSAAAFLLFPLLASNVWSAAALRLLAGVGLAGVYLPGARIVAATAAPAARGLWVGIYVSAFYLGAALSLWATGVLLPVLGWQGASLLLGGLAALGLPAAVLGTRHSPPPAGHSARLNLRVLERAAVRRTILAYAGHSWELYVSRGWLAAFLAAVLGAHGMASMEAASDAGKWAALMAGLGTVGVWLGGALSDRLGRARTAAAIAIASGSLSLGFGWLGVAHWTILVLVGCAYSVLIAADSSIYTTAITELAPPGQLGSTQAAQAAIGFLTSAVAPVAAGLVLDLNGGFGGVFMLAGLCSIAGGLGLVPLMQHDHGRTIANI